MSEFNFGITNETSNLSLSISSTNSTISLSDVTSPSSDKTFSVSDPDYFVSAKDSFLDKPLKKNDYGEYVELTEKEINDWLVKNGFHPLTDGHFNEDNPFKIVGMYPDGSYLHGKFYAKLAFCVEMPNGNRFCYPLECNCNSVQSFGIVYVPKVGDKFVLTEENRAGAGKKLLGFPRGFPELEKSDSTVYLEGVGNVNASVILRELGEEVMKHVIEMAANGDVKLKYLGRVYENSSTSLTAPDYVEVQMPEECVPDGGTEGLKIGLYSLEEVRELVRTHQICDSHTLSALSLYLCN